MVKGTEFLRIVRVRHLFYPDMPRDYFYELSARQASKSHEIDVVTWNRSSNCAEEVVEDGFVVHRLPGLNISFGRIVQEYPYLPRLPAEIEKLKPDVVHAESHLFLTTVQAVRKAKRLRLPCVVTVHGVFAERGLALDFAQNVYLHTLGLEVFKCADRVVCLTYSGAMDIVRLGCPSRKIRLIPNAVDTELFQPHKEGRDDLVVWVGRFVPEKGIEYLVKAAKTVSEKSSAAKFLFIGYGPLKAKIVKMANDYGLLGRVVTIAGPMNRREVAKILGKATIFAFPSLKEGLPLSVLEAMASGLPVVGSDIAGIRENILEQQTGLLVPPKDPEAMANSILALLADEDLRRKLGQNARQLTIERYGWDSAIGDMEKVYYEAIAEAN